MSEMDQQITGWLECREHWLLKSSFRMTNYPLNYSAVSSSSSSTSNNSMTSYIPNCENIRVDLQDMEMWRTFTTGVMNEMIITKTGRKLFPVMRVRIRGLDPTRMYSVAMEFGQVGTNRYKYNEGGWQSAGKAEVQPLTSTYVHHKSPNYGKFWTNGYVDFSKIKVSNKQSEDMIWMNSMHMYEPRIIISRIDPLAADGEVIVFQKRFEIGRFMAVTSYQNDDVTKLKVKYNPFAKGFVETRAAKQKQIDEQETGIYPRVCSPPAYGSYQGPSGNLQVPSTWSSEVLQAQNIFPASFPPVHHHPRHQPSSRYNPYARPTPAVKIEPGYSADFAAAHVSSSSNTSALYEHQRRHAPFFSPASTGAYNHLTPSSYYNNPNTNYSSGYATPIDLSGSAHQQNDAYSSTVSSTQQFTYGHQDTLTTNSYSQAANLYNAYYGQGYGTGSGLFHGTGNNSNANNGAGYAQQQQQQQQQEMKNWWSYSSSGSGSYSDSGSSTNSSPGGLSSSSGSPVDIDRSQPAPAAPSSHNDTATSHCQDLSY
ncbi:putative Brachyury protein-like protein [Hypsibius exemplaris]|uniref:Brachyury protein-like protein n=1 Tax=Hypsibius exemplaris TaxID=2072580 RepID=A0A1W0XBJ8_HYPEX|nr:putative Brachyury protein-like protein [Hypsibius exemplaris]